MPVTAERILDAWKLFARQPLRRWSFTDCTSKVVMDELHIRKALSFDSHFKEFDGVEVLL